MMAAEGVALDRSELQFALDLRYAGQSSELGIPVEQCRPDARNAGRRPRSSFISNMSAPMAIAAGPSGCRSSICACAPAAWNAGIICRRRRRCNRTGADRAGASGQVYFGPERGWVTAPVIRRNDLTETPLQGPLIVEEYDTTIIVPPGATVHATSGMVRIHLKGRISHGCDQRSHPPGIDEERLRGHRRRDGGHRHPHRPLLGDQGGDGFFHRPAGSQRQSGGARACACRCIWDLSRPPWRRCWRNSPATSIPAMSLR